MDDYDLGASHYIRIWYLSKTNFVYYFLQKVQCDHANLSAAGHLPRCFVVLGQNCKSNLLQPLWVWRTSLLCDFFVVMAKEAGIGNWRRSKPCSGNESLQGQQLICDRVRLTDLSIRLAIRKNKTLFVLDSRTCLVPIKRPFCRSKLWRGITLNTSLKLSMWWRSADFSWELSKSP